MHMQHSLQHEDLRAYLVNVMVAQTRAVLHLRHALHQTAGYPWSRRRRAPEESPSAKAIPPAAPTRDEAIRNFSMRGARPSKPAIAAAPLSSLMLLYRANDL